VNLRRRALGLRARLTLWYSLAVCAALVLLGGGALTLLDRELRANLDASLLSMARAAAESTRQASVSSPLEDLLDSVFGLGHPRHFFQLLDPFGRPDPRVPEYRQAPLPLSEGTLRNAEHGLPTFETLALRNPPGHIRMLTYPVTERGRVVHLVQVAMSLTGIEEATAGFLHIFVLLGPMAVVVFAAGGWILTSRAIAPVDAMVRTARRIEAEDLSRRIEGGARDDELGRLAAVLNDMLDRLERSFAVARQFGADAAHELRTPLTILKGEIDVALRSAADEQSYRNALSSCREEVERISSLLEDLLLLAQADAGALTGSLGTVDLAEVIDDAAPALEALAQQGEAQLAIHRAPGLRVRGGTPLLLRILMNLVDNAVKHGGKGAHIRLRAGRKSDAVLLEVLDDGPGIASADRTRIFERFYRSDAAQSRGGAGLGLAIVRSIVLALGGHVAVDSEPGKGSCFQVRLPFSDAA
jgi:heavy metal sensor kinase